MNDEQKEELKRLHAHGQNDYQIAMLMNVTRDNVISARRALKLPPVRHLKPQGWEFSFTPTPKPNPVLVARGWLGPRLSEQGGGYRLDDVPCTFKAVMRETNRLRSIAGVEQITSSPEWAYDRR